MGAKCAVMMPKYVPTVTGGLCICILARRDVMGLCRGVWEEAGGKQRFKVTLNIYHVALG